ncbi:TRAP transporter large permease [Fluviibacterium sp. DFM31]|uniref:TRAP transporter large permease protein n=1 Tax=Meridianimarinicoccus marinus TaxID=3231483 RepID=A0ABV3L7W1_9RHOB
MIDIVTIAVGFACMLAFLLTGLHVASVMMLTALIGILAGFGPSMFAPLGNMMWAEQNSFILTAIPLYILMGEILVHSDVARRMYRSLADWLSWLPGGLLHTNIASSAMFAAISGSSVATAATIGTVAFPTFRAQGYDEKWVAGSIASGATLGILIPPSINLIIYGAITETSIGALFIAGMVPGLLLALMFMLTIAVAALIWPELAGSGARPDPDRSGRIARLKDLVAPVVIFTIIIASIYAGWATPTEAAAVGVVAALGLSMMNRTFNRKMLHASLFATVRITAMILLVLTAAFFLNFTLGLLGIPALISGFVGGLDVPPMLLIACLVVFYLVLGCFLDALAMMITTVPILFPIVIALGFDPLWFGVFVVIMCELALLTPPVGMNLYVVQGVRKAGQLTDVIRGVLPFFLAILGLVVLMTTWPPLITWLPKLMAD